MDRLPNESKGTFSNGFTFFKFILLFDLAGLIADELLTLDVGIMVLYTW